MSDLIYVCLIWSNKQFNIDDKHVYFIISPRILVTNKSIVISLLFNDITSYTEIVQFATAIHINILYTCITAIHKSITY